MKLFTGLFVNKYEFENAPVLKLKRFFLRLRWIIVRTPWKLPV